MYLQLAACSLQQAGWQHELRHLHRLEQRWYLPRGFNLTSAGLAEHAFVFLPPSCMGRGWSACRVHISYHGSHPHDRGKFEDGAVLLQLWAALSGFEAGAEIQLTCNLQLVACSL